MPDGAKITMGLPESIRSIPDVCDVEVMRSPAADPEAPPDLVFEIPHGATRAQHYETLRGRLNSTLPDNLDEFFFINTDVGAPECAARAARQIVAPTDSPFLARLLGHDEIARIAERPAWQVLIVRCLIPRTFIDCNRVVEAETRDLHSGGLTQSLPAYITEPADRELLTSLHRTYSSIATQAIDWVCDQGGQALLLHTYAPKSVGIVNVDGGIVEALRRAYEPLTYDTWEDRPPVDIISESIDDVRHAPPGLVEALRDLYAEIDVDVTENVSYRLHEGTMGYVHSARHPGKILSLEINRALLADPFVPFREMTIGEKKVRRMAAPIAAAYLSELTRLR